jgi:colanic acid biosynthesis glycosyl transferase WcaI
MRILFVTHYFQPEPFFMGLPFAKALANLGHEIEVLTSFPNYPGGKLYQGYKQRPIFREVIDGIPIIRVPLYPSHDKSSMKRIACYATHALSAATFGVAAVKRADVAYIGEGPATIGLPACMLKLIRGIPFVFHILDLWPDSIEATGMFKNKTGLWLAHKWCQYTYKRASKLVLCTPGYKQILMERGVPPEKMEIIYNWCDDSQVSRVEPDPKLAQQLGLAGKFNIIYAGNLGAAQSLGSVLDAAKIVQSQNDRVQFVFIGTGLEENDLKSKAASMNLKNVLFLPKRPTSEISRILSLADVLLSHLKDEPLFKITIPGKIQAYMASGKPILVAVRGDASDLVTMANAGFACEPDNPAAIAATVMKFYNLAPSELVEIGEKGRRFYERELSMSIAVKKFEKIFEAVAARKKQPPSHKQ